MWTGYWPSYNVPFYEEVFNISGYANYVAKFGSDFSYQLAPRAKIFRRDQGKVTEMKGFQNILRYNGKFQLVLVLPILFIHNYNM